MTRLLLHGFTGSPRAFAGANAAAPLLPGHGDAPLATGWDRAVDDLAAQVPRGCALGGYSMGARLALAVALRVPERLDRLLLVSGAPGLDDARERAARRAADEELATLLEREGLDAFLRRWEANPILAGQPHAALREQRRSHRPEGLASALRALGQGAQPALWSELPRLELPVLLVAGERDPKYVAIARRMQALLPRAEVQVIAGAGHAPHLEGKFDWRTT